MAYALLAIGVLALVLVVNAYWPVRREPMATLSFFAGWLCGELPLQNLVVTVVVAVVFGALGALGSWAGWLGLVLLVLAACGLVGLAVLGARATRVTMAALAATTGGEIALPAAPPPAAWGSWWRLSRAVPFAGRSVSVVRNLDFAGDGAAAHRLDVLSPRTPASGAPVMVYIHGGAWVIGDKREQGKPMMFELVSRGWVCVTINYRLSPKATWPEHIIDCKQALAWVKAHIAEYGGDPGFVAVSGGSAGGHLAALIALTPNALEWQPGFEAADTSVDACLPYYGVYEMTGDPAGTGLHGSGLLELLQSRVMKTTIEADRQLFERASPTYRVNADAPPFYVAHGTNDTLVPVEVARTFVAALRKASSAPVTYVELPRAQHAFDVLASLRSRATTMGAVLFLDSIRAPAAASGSSGAPALGDAAGDQRP